MSLQWAIKSSILSYRLKYCQKVPPICSGTNILTQRYLFVSSQDLQEQQAYKDGLSNLKPISDCPGPSSLSIIGSILSLIFDPVAQDKLKQHLLWYRLTKKYGPIFKIKAPTQPLIVCISTLEDSEKLCIGTMNNPIRYVFKSLRKVRVDTPGNVFENKGGLLPENGEEWWRLRSRVQIPMMKPKNIALYLDKMDRVSLDFMERIVELQTSNGGKEVSANFINELYKWAFESVCMVALNRRMGCLEKDLAPDSTPLRMIQAANQMLSALNVLETSFPWYRWFPTKQYRQLKQAHQLFLELAQESIKEIELQVKDRAERGEDPKITNMMEALLNTPGLTKADVLTMIIDLMLAGIDTTAHTISFTMYLLATNPKIQQRLQKEVDEVIGDSKDPLTKEHLARMSYMKAVVKESLRLYPLLLGQARVIPHDLGLAGYRVPAGSLVVCMNILISKQESVFKDATEFLPERWSRDQPLGKINPFASLPFSHGRRMCIGRRIAEQELYTFLARVSQRFTIEYNHDRKMELMTRLIIGPSIPLNFTFIERK